VAQRLGSEARSLKLAALAAALIGATSAQGQPADAASTPASTAAGSPRYAFDPTHTAVHWEVVHMGTSTIRGRFDKLAGTVDFDAKAHRLDVSIEVDTASVNSGVPLLDTILRGRELLAPADEPKAYFTAKTVSWDGDVPREVRGEFTLKGQSEPLTLTATRWRCAFSVVFRREVCGGDFEGEFRRSRFGITHSLPFVDDKVKLLIEVEAIRQ
jgi:polyisoprenoid-binding protein YceI